MPRPLIPQRRDRILDAAAALAVSQGWENTTVAALAAHAGIGKGAVYREFADKSAILDAALRRDMRDMTRQVHQEVLRAGTLVDLPLVYRFGVEALLRHPLMRAMFLADSRVLGRHVREVSDQRYAARLDWLTEYIGRLQDANVIDSRVPQATLSAMLSTFTIGLIHAPHVLGETDSASIRDTVELFSTLVGHGVAAQEPADQHKAQQAQQRLLDHLGTQLDEMEKQ